MEPTVVCRQRMSIKGIIPEICCFFLVSMFLTLIPTQASANAAAIASVDNVLGSLAEVVKDRAKSVARRTIVKKLRNDLCEGKEIKIGDTTFYLGGSETCHNNNYNDNICNNNDLFVDTCRLTEPDYGMLLTDPHLLKTLSRDTVGLAIRLSSYKLSNEEFEQLNLKQFEEFVHGVMEDMVNGKKGRAAFLKRLNTLIESYTSSDSAYLSTIAKGIGGTTEFPTLRNAIINSNTVDTTIPSKYTNGSVLTISKMIDTEGKKDITIENRNEDSPFTLLFKQGSFKEALDMPCSKAYQGEVDADVKITKCQVAQLAVRLKPLLDKFKSSSTSPITNKDIRNMMYTLDESDIYIDALKGVGVTNAETVFEEFSLKTKEKLSEAWSSRQAIKNSLLFATSVIQAFAKKDPDNATEWLKNLREDMYQLSRKPNIQDLKLCEVGSINSLNWLNRNNLDKDVQKMRDNFKQLLSTLWLLRYKAEEKKVDIDKLVDIAVNLSNFGANMPSDIESGWNISDMVYQISQLMEIVVDSMPGESDQSEKIKMFISSLKEFTKILDYAVDRDWVGISLEVTKELIEHRGSKNKKLGNVPMNALRFTRTLLSMYQAESVEGAKEIFKATLEEESSRERRYETFTIDVGALVGMRLGYVKQEWDKDFSVTDRETEDFGYGIFAPLGVQLAKGGGGVMIYPVDLGGYLSGSLADETADVRVQSALHSGLALYWRPSADTPVVVGASGDYKPSFDEDDTSEWRGSFFITLELPLFMIK